jgi:hypothetical protein
MFPASQLLFISLAEDWPSCGLGHCVKYSTRCSPLTGLRMVRQQMLRNSLCEVREWEMQVGVSNRQSDRREQ